MPSGISDFSSQVAPFSRAFSGNRSIDCDIIFLRPSSLNMALAAAAAGPAFLQRVEHLLGYLDCDDLAQFVHLHFDRLVDHSFEHRSQNGHGAFNFVLLFGVVVEVADGPTPA